MRRMFSEKQLITLIGKVIDKTLPESFDADMEWVESVKDYIKYDENNGIVLENVDLCLSVISNLYFADDGLTLEDYLAGKQDKLYYHNIEIIGNDNGSTPASWVFHLKVISSSGETSTLLTLHNIIGGLVNAFAYDEDDKYFIVSEIEVTNEGIISAVIISLTTGGTRGITIAASDVSSYHDHKSSF